MEEKVRVYEREKVEYKDLSGMLKMAAIGGVIYFFFAIIAFFIGFLSVLLM